MNNLTWQDINKDTAKFIELFVLPNTLAFTLAKLYYEGIEITDSYDVFYNTIKNFFNIINEDKELIFKITCQTLHIKYGLEFKTVNPIALEKIN